MGEYIKNNEGKKVLTSDNDKDKNDIKNSLMQAIVSEKPNVKWEDVAGLSKAKDALK